jgi:hypothetical protein
LRDTLHEIVGPGVSALDDGQLASFRKHLQVSLNLPEITGYLGGFLNQKIRDAFLELHPASVIGGSTATFSPGENGVAPAEKPGDADKSPVGSPESPVNPSSQGEAEALLMNSVAELNLNLDHLLGEAGPADAEAAYLTQMAAQQAEVQDVVRAALQLPRSVTKEPA